MTNLKEKLASFGRPLNANEVADCLGIPSDQVYRYARKGAITHYRHGKLVRFDPADVYEYAQAVRVKGMLR